MTDEVNRETLEWLDTPLQHLGDGTKGKRSRRDVIEMVVIEKVEKIRRDERLRVRSKDFLTFAAIVTVLLSVAPQILAFLGIGL